MHPRRLASGCPGGESRPASGEARAQSLHDPAGRDARTPRRGARHRRDRRRAGGALRGDRATHRRAARPRPVRGHALHHGAAGGLLPSGAARSRRALGRLGRALLLGARAGSGAGRGAAAALHVARRLRGAAREAGAARRAARRDVPRAGGREPARRPRGCGAGRRRLLRQEHDDHHPAPRLLGRARHARHGRRRSSRRRRSSSTAASAGSASTRARRARSTSPASSTRRAASPTGRSRGRRSPSAYREELGDQVYGCDICQDVCPWNRGVEKRRAGRPLSEGAEPVVSLVDWLRGRPGRALTPLRPPVRAAKRRPLPAAERADRARKPRAPRCTRRRSRLSPSIRCSAKWARGEAGSIRERARQERAGAPAPAS